MNRLKELRLNAGLSQAKLAEIAETTQRNISYWESGNIDMNLDAAIKIAQFFQVEIEYLAGYTNDLGVKSPLNQAVFSVYSTEEKQLIEKYRNLSPESKKLLKDLLKSLGNNN